MISLDYITFLCIGLSILSGLIWLFLLTAWGRFWRCDCLLVESETPLTHYPRVCAIVPARDEAEVIAQSLRSLLSQDYPGQFSLILVDDLSSDGTGDIAQTIAQEMGQSQRLSVLLSQPLPPRWTGKLWALENGVQYALKMPQTPDYFFFTDADICHDRTNLRQLVTKAEQEKLALASVMVKLHCQSFWEKLLIPAFVFFFQKLYPFSWVNDPHKATAAAAGGCILLRQTTLQEMGGLVTLQDALIDDCTLATQVKQQTQSKIWLGLTTQTSSLRPYSTLHPLWMMVARTAYTQLNYSPLLLVGTVLGMGLVYLVAPLTFLGGLITGNWLCVGFGGGTWGLSAIAYWPTLKLYQLSKLQSITLPGIAFLYTLMTLDSARRHWQGKGGSWKGRQYQQNRE